MELDVASISIDVENFRHAKVAHERDAIRLLLGDEKAHRVAELAEDIVAQKGLDPSSRLIVTKVSPGKYIALEGNRRVTALKTLASPDLAQGLATHAVFKKHHGSFLALGLRKVECVVLSRQEAAVWIKRKHYKGMGGKGVMPWNAVATARSDAAEGSFSRWMTALAFIEERGTDAEEIRDLISRKTTTVERVLMSPQMLSTLGLQFGKSGTVKIDNGDEHAAAKLILSMLTEMASSDFKETLVSTAEQQGTWISSFVSLSVKKPEKGKSGDKAGGGGTGGGDTGGGGEQGGASGGTSGGSSGTGGSGTGSGTRSGTGGRQKSTKGRKVLADKGLRISNVALNRFYGELRKITPDRNPFICAAVIRVFLEKATTHFLEEMKVPPLDKRPDATWHDFGIKLRNKVEAALTTIDPAGANPKLAPARDVANGVRDKLHSLDELNRAVHDHAALPAGSETLTIWDRFHPYFQLLFETIEKSKP